MKIDKQTRNRWKKYVRLYMREHGYTAEDVKSIAQMWQIAFRLEIPREAYHIDKSVKDSHIETALMRIFPNVNKKGNNNESN